MLTIFGGVPLLMMTVNCAPPDLTMNGFIDGAVRSGERVAAEVLAAEGAPAAQATG